MFQEIHLKTSDKHLDIKAIELAAGGDNIKLVNTNIPPLSNSDAGYKTTISKLPDDSIFHVDFNAHSPLWYSTQPEDTREKNIGNEIDLFNQLFLTKKGSKIAICKSSPDISPVSLARAKQ